MTEEPTFISARNHRQLYLGGGYDGPYGGDVAVWMVTSTLRHGIGGTGWTDVYLAAASRPTSRCYLGGDPRLESIGAFFAELR